MYHVQLRSGLSFSSLSNVTNQIVEFLESLICCTSGKKQRHSITAEQTNEQRVYLALVHVTSVL